MQDDASVSGVPKDFVHRYLPWVVAGAALGVYGVTLNRWPTFFGLPTLARVAGWDWHPVLYGPVHFLATYPVRWLPGSWQFLALNLFSALCAVLTLGLLARSVALLPHDRTRDQRALERSDFSLLSIRSAWLPPVFAALVCGLQLTFWENAAFATVEMLDLLLFAYVIRCLLEYRLDQRESWLAKAVFVYGLGMTSNLALVGFFPAWLMALVWVKGRAFFNWRFLLRMVALGCAGLLLHLLLPAINAASELVEMNFWELLRGNLGYQKSILLGVPRYIILLIGLTSLAPVLFMGIRWPAQFGDISVAGNYLTNVMTHVIHGLFLAACLYVAFDPAFSPRQLGGGFLTFLPFYYLGALAIGYCSGYFLLVFGPRPVTKSWQRPSLLRRGLNYLLVALVWISAGAVPAGLAYRNLPQIRLSNAPYLSELSAAAARQLPAEGAVVLSDDPIRLYALQAALGQAGVAVKHVLLDTTALPAPAYHKWLQGRYPQQWPALPVDKASLVRLEDNVVVEVLAQVARTRQLYYLHPTFGYFMEHFYLKPRQALYQLIAYPTNRLSGLPPTPAELQENVEFWRQFKAARLGPLEQAVNPPKAKTASGQPPLNPLVAFTGAIFSRALNCLGVELQKAGDLPGASEFFGHALNLNPRNPTAFINQEFNAALRAQKPQSGPSPGATDRLKPYGGNWNNILGLNGPVDEPNSSYLLARTFSQGGNHRQAAQLLERVVSFNPADRGLQLELANAYVAARFPDKAMDMVRALRSATSTNALDPSDDLAITQTEAWAQVGRNDLARAEELLSAAQQKYPRIPGGFGTMAEIYLTLGRTKDAMAVLERQVQIQTNHVNAIVNLAALRMRESAWEKAIPLLDQALALSPRNVAARMNRAIAHLSLAHLDAAQQDLEHLERTAQTPTPQVHYCLGEVYTQKKMWKRATEHYEKYLKLGPRTPAEEKYVRDRLQALKRGRL